MLKTIKKYVSRPSFLSQKIFSRNFVAIKGIETVLTLTIYNIYHFGFKQTVAAWFSLQRHSGKIC